MGPGGRGRFGLVEAAVVVLFVAALVWAVRAAQIGWGNHLSDMHGFRQAQTALTSYYLQRGAPFLRYETPVLGAPWAIPFEFPLYQWLVARGSALTASPLEQTGRLVSELFFVAALGVLWAILGRLHIPPVLRLPFLALALASPQYIFWSRAFLIESTALFFCLGYLLFVLRYVQTPRLLDVVLGAGFGIAAALVKVTTLPAFVAMGVVALAARTEGGSPLRGLRSGARWKDAASLLLLFASPPAAAVLWTLHADRIKEANPIGALLTSGRLREWTLGTLAQRLDGRTWSQIYEVTIPDAVGSSLALVLAGLALVGTRARSRAVPALACLAGFLIPHLLFPGLFFIHNYYAYANAVFLVGFVGFGIVALLESARPAVRVAGPAVLLLCLIFAARHYDGNYRPAQAGNDTAIYDLGRAIARHTAPDSVFVAFGLDWSAEAPFYAERRGLLIPNWILDEDRAASRQPSAGPGPLSVIDASVRRLTPSPIDALVLCNDPRSDAATAQSLRQRFAVTEPPVYQREACAVYSLAGTGGRLR